MSPSWPSSTPSGLGSLNCTSSEGELAEVGIPGICILMTEGVRSEAAYQRLEIMRRTSDGFKIAEKDLEIRGPGEFVGTRQSGLPEFRFGNIVRDREALELAALEAKELLREMLREADRPAVLMNQLIDQWKERYGLYVVG